MLPNSLSVKVFAACLFLLVIPAADALAQKAWTLQQCIDHALQNNLNIRQSDISTLQSEVEINRSKAGFYPSLNGSTSYQYNFGRSLDPTSYQFTTQEIRSANISLNGNVPLFNGFQLQNSLRQSKLEYLASQHDLKKIQNDVSLNVVSAYLQVLYAKEQLKVTSARLNESTQQRDRTKKMVDAGVMTQGNLLDAESQLTNEELNQITAENQLSIAKLTLLQLLELDTISNFDIEDPLVQSPEMTTLAQTPFEIYALSLTTLPEIKSADTRILSAEKNLAATKGNFYPRLSLFGGLNSGYSSARETVTGTNYVGLFPTAAVTQSGEAVLSPVFFTNTERTNFRDQMDQNFSKNFGLSLNIPIFNGLNTYSNVRQSRLNLENARITSELTRNQLFKSIQQAHTDAIAAQRKLAATEKAVVALQEAYMYAEKRFNAGLSNSLEFLTATNNLTRARIDSLQARYDLIFKVKVLDFYAGRPLAF